MPTLWIFDIEPHEQRYTSEWKKHLPKQLRGYLRKRKRSIWKVEVVRVPRVSGALSNGAFLDFAETNIYKSNQVAAFARKIRNGMVNRKDRLLFTDAWHPGVIQCRYMSDLLKLNLSIDVMWHAGSYDKNDILSQRIKNKRWSLSFERSIFEAANRNYFATNYHHDLFKRRFNIKRDNKLKIVGWPMEYLLKLLAGKQFYPNKNTIVFPHRLSPEKQPEILKQLKPLLSHYKIVFAQSTPMIKSAYHDLLGESIACFSASKQETLGIGTYEAMLCGAIPIVPDRLSYSEMYGNICYNSDWTISNAAAQTYGPAIVSHFLNLQSKYSPKQVRQVALTIGDQYFHGGKLYDELFR